MRYDVKSLKNWLLREWLSITIVDEIAHKMVVFVSCICVQAMYSDSDAFQWSHDWRSVFRFADLYVLSYCKYFSAGYCNPHDNPNCAVNHALFDGFLQCKTNGLDCPAKDNPGKWKIQAAGELKSVKNEILNIDDEFQ